MQAHRIFIGMGSNVPEAFDLLRTAVLRLSEMAEGDVVVSTPERTEPIDFPWPAMFVNQVASLLTTLELDELKTRLKRIERRAGRTKRETQWGIIRLDLDLLSVDDDILRPDDWQRPYIRRGIAEISDKEWTSI